MSWLNTAKNIAVNLPGWRTKRKIVVFESDDWGMIRMASKDAFERLLKKGYPVDRSVYNRFDAIAQNEDVEDLMEVLDSVSDKNGKPAKFTLNTVVGNPDFQRIQESDFTSYYYEPLTETQKRYSKADRLMDLFRQGIDKAFFTPQFHGREHLQVNNWLEKLQDRNPGFVEAFKEGMYTINPPQGMSCRHECLDGMAYYKPEDIDFVEQSVTEGLKLFKEIWGFPSASVIAPCYTWHTDLEQTFAAQGVHFVQGARAQRQAEINKKKKTIKRHYMGGRSKSGLHYLIRNVHFEPVENPNTDWVDAAMGEIQTAFRMRKPAIISSHRVNYVGRLDTAHRDKNLNFLLRLLKKIVRTYPDVEFMSSDQVGSLIIKSRS